MLQALISPQKEHAGDGIIPISLRKKFVPRHLLSNLSVKFPRFCVHRTTSFPGNEVVQGSVKWQAGNLFPFWTVIDEKGVKIQLGSWWSDDSISKFLIDSLWDHFYMALWEIFISGHSG